MKGHFLSTYEPETAVEGVLIPKPTLRTQRVPRALRFKVFLYPKKTVGCFWKAFSVYSKRKDMIKGWTVIKEAEEEDR